MSICRNALRLKYNNAKVMQYTITYFQLIIAEYNQTAKNYFFNKMLVHDDVIKWKHFPRNWPFVRGIHRSRWIPHTKASDAELWCFLWSE